MTAAADDLFEWGPPRRLPALARLPAPILPGVASRAGLVAVIGWVPLAVLVVATPSLASSDALASFERDIAAHARSALAAPMLVLAHVFCARRLGVVAHHFGVSGLLADDGRQALQEAIEDTRRLVRSIWAEVAAILLAYGLIGTLLVLQPEALRPAAWQASADGTSFSPAGWWQVGVSAPLLLVLALGWVWRIAMWARLLGRVARLPLRLIAAHPDQAAGLGFLSQSVRAFGAVGFAIGVIVAGRFANVHLAGTASQFTDMLLAGGTALLAVAIGVGPLLVFTAPMMKAWRTGAMTYGALATELGGQFERAWLARPPTGERPMLSEPDFSAATDLYQVVANVYAMRFVPVDVRSLLILVGATLAPFIPAMLLSMPLETVLTELKGLLF